jgi:hypothetical protein
MKNLSFKEFWRNQKENLSKRRLRRGSFERQAFQKITFSRTISPEKVIFLWKNKKISIN